jgi:hypothetical protein
MSWTPQEAFEDIARGDKAAVEFMSAFYLWVHAQDDLIDRDKPANPAASTGFNLQILRAFATNIFFQKHQDFIWPVILTGALAYIVSEDKRKAEDVLDRITAQILKSQYADVFFAIAFLIGGFDHALTMKRKYHNYSFDDENSTPLNRGCIL